MEREINSLSVDSDFGLGNITPLRENPTFLAAATANVCWDHKLLFSDSSACFNNLP